MTVLVLIIFIEFSLENFSHNRTLTACSLWKNGGGRDGLLLLVFSSSALSLSYRHLYIRMGEKR